MNIVFSAFFTLAIGLCILALLVLFAALVAGLVVFFFEEGDDHE